MSGLREIIEWVQREVILNPANSVDVEFESISRMFEKDNRSALADILRDDTPEFLEFLESRLSGASTITETDEEIKEPEPRAPELEPRIRELSQGIANGLANLLGTPMRTIDSIVTPIVRTVEEVIEEPISIIGRVSNFIRGLFR